MHRKNPLSVKVKAPSRGLVTRWPSPTADLRNEQDLQRVCVAAENMRFEDGVMCNAPGFERVAIAGLPLLTNLVSHWKLDEADGIRYDSYGQNHFDAPAPIQNITRVVGKINYAVRATGIGQLPVLSPAGLSPGAGDFTVAGWFFYDPGTANVFAVDKSFSDFFGTTTEYQISFDGTRLKFQVGRLAGGNDIVTSSLALSASTWYFFAAWRDTVGHTVNIRVNATVTSAASAAGALVTTAGTFGITGSLSGTGPRYVDSLSYYSRALPTGDLDALYNSGTGLDFPFFTGGAFRFLYQGKVLRTPANPFYMGNTERVFAGGRAFISSPRQYTLAATEIYPGASGSPVAGATSEFRWKAIDFIDKVALVQNGIAPQYHISGDARIIPGLPTGNKYDGCESFFNHLLLWKDQTLKWSDTADLTTWIPVANTISNLRLTLIDPITQPAINADATDNVTSDTWLPVTENPAGLTVGQYVRIDDTQAALPYYNFYLVDAVSPAAGLTGQLVAFGDQTVLGSATTQIFLAAHVAWTVGQRISIGSDANILTVAEVDTNNLTYFSINDSSVAVTPRNTGVSATFSIDNQNTGFQVGEYVSLGVSLTPAQDIFLITAIVVNSTGTLITLQDKYLGSNRNVTSYSRGAYIVRQPWVKLTKANAGTVAATAGLLVNERYAVKIKLQDLTGRTATGTTILAGKVIATLNANETGETVVIGAEDNGPIWQTVAMGEYAHIFKNRSIQSLQYVGRASGTFFIRAEIKNEGLIARNSIVKLNDSRVSFLGNRELYDYQGGLSLKPVCMQYTRQLFAELDRTRLNDIVLHHREQRNELWVVYPTIGSSKVLIWNYIEDTAAIDTYDPSMGLITAAELADWINDPTWFVLADSLTWDNIDPLTNWDAYTGTGFERASVLASADGQLLVHGNVFSRNGLGYYCFAETMDLDCGDDSAFKYVDGVQVSLQVTAPDNASRKIYVQVGYRNNLDSSITWTDPQALTVSGNGQPMTKVNPGGAGRYLRLRFYSTDAGVQWRVAAYNLFVRLGGNY